LIEEARTNVLLNSATLGTQSVAVTAQAYTLSFYGTGTVTLSGTSTGSLVGTGAFPTRVALTFTPTAGTLTCTVTGSVLNANLEAGGFATSWIATTAASVTRAVDVCSMPTAAWYQRSPCSLMFEVFYPNDFGNGRIIGGLGDSSSANAGFFQGQYWLYGGGTAYSTGAALPANAVSKLCGTINNTALLIQAGVNGTVGPTVAMSSTPGPATTLAFGTPPWALGAAQLGGYIRRVRYWPRVLTNAELQQVTT
jgi:hypothetical protein